MNISSSNIDLSCPLSHLSLRPCYSVKASNKLSFLCHQVPPLSETVNIDMFIRAPDKMPQ